jgi:hypothetical protein
VHRKGYAYKLTYEYVRESKLQFSHLCANDQKKASFGHLKDLNIKPCLCHGIFETRIANQSRMRCVGYMSKNDQLVCICQNAEYEKHDDQLVCICQHVEHGKHDARPPYLKYGIRGNKQILVLGIHVVRG